MDPIVKRLLENHKLTESTIDLKKLESEIREKVKEVMTSPEFGFDAEKDPNDKYSVYWEDYCVVEIRKEEGFYIVEVRGEFGNFDTETEMCDALDPIVAKYDKDAYFEPYDAGILDAYIQK